MATDSDPRPGRTMTGGQTETPVFHDPAEQQADQTAIGVTHLDHRLADEIAAKTETPYEAAIDAANGLRSHGGRAPVPEDFEGILTPAGNSGGVVGTDVTEGSTFTIGRDSTTKGTIED